MKGKVMGKKTTIGTYVLKINHKVEGDNDFVSMIPMTLEEIDNYKIGETVEVVVKKNEEI